MTNVTQEKPLHELLSRSMVDIYVGSDNTHWILHEKLLCHHSPFFRKIFYKKGSTTTSFGLPEEEYSPFKTFVGWLYSSSLPVPREESDLGVLFDLYLMAEKFQTPALIADVLQVVREWYKYSDSYPGLRRVQYIYANTEDGSPMRHMLVHSVARLMVLENGMKPHWDKALRKNGQLAVDIIKAIQDWRLDEDAIPDAREEPELGEELVDVEAELKEQQEAIDAEEDGEDVEAKEDGEGESKVEAEEEGNEAEGENAKEQKDDSEAHDDSEDTVVGSPEDKKVEQRAQTKTQKTNGFTNGVKKLGFEDGFKQVSNGLGNGDYGTLAH
ncbi:hypothetical protein K504DRAFT_501035 [Pleomassaria siparia CBS 279.74]|uniref:BTB domain-containing protein n=1 Tax=Pleomassaria siparia CBS 279.74 TaxID=1314801 RepID=A0A6G1KEY2_9PLEO|nr:hypothetical protein K504DRAFT_501035 [Pleomassaria siparia CBS 279.74]